MAEKITAGEITFEQMSEEQAVKTFQEDAYFEYNKRRVRYGDSLPPNSIWATIPATMFVAFYKGTPVGIVGFSRYKGVLLGAGVHIRREYRGRGLLDILIDKAIKEKRSRTLYINIANQRIANNYRAKGFKDMNKDELPEDVKQELGDIRYTDQVQKLLSHSSPKWQQVLKRRRG